MSAFMVSDEHVHVLLSWALSEGQLRGYPASWPVNGDAVGVGIREYSRGSRARELTIESAGTVGQIIVEANARSVDYRYREDTNVRAYAYRRPRTVDREPVEIIKACRCVAYQSCEVDDWPRSEAHAILEAITDMAVSRLPGMDDAAWDIERDTPTLGEIEVEEARERRERA